MCISENKLAGDLKIGHYNGNIFFFFYWDVILLETEWNLANIDESVNKTCKTHKKHRIKQDTNVYISENKLAGDLKIGH